MLGCHLSIIKPWRSTGLALSLGGPAPFLLSHPILPHRDHPSYSVSSDPSPPISPTHPVLLDLLIPPAPNALISCPTPSFPVPFLSAGRRRVFGLTVQEKQSIMIRQAWGQESEEAGHTICGE